MASPKVILNFLKNNFDNLLSDNELGALKGLTKEKDIIKEYGSLPKYNITGEDLIFLKITLIIYYQIMS